MYLEFVYGSDKTEITCTDDAIQLYLNSHILGHRDRLRMITDIEITGEGDGKLFFLNDEIMGGVFSIDPGPDIRMDTYLVYKEIMERTSGFKLCRAWNYIPGIHDSCGLQSVYECFNEGRSGAFSEYQTGPTPLPPPASTGIDIHGDRLAIVFIATKNEVAFLSNPLQTNSFQYPEKFGKKPPAFSRATGTMIRGRPVVFVSGTASIRGSESVHPGDDLAQLDTTIENIHIMLDQAGIGRDALSTGQYNGTAVVYIRKKESYKEIREHIRRFYPSFVNSVFLHANICRKDLDVEICLTAWAI